MEIWNIVHKKAYFGFLTKEGAVLIQLLERTNQVGWESKRGSSTGRRKKWVKRRGTRMQADSQTHTHKHRQRSHSLTRHPILSQTGGKMLYFPSKLKCQLILMWKRRGPNTQCRNTQAAFTLTDTSFRISNVALLPADGVMHTGHRGMCQPDQAHSRVSSHLSHEGYF